MGKGRGTREWGGKIGWKMGMHEKIVQNVTDLAFGDAPWDLPPASYVLESSFQEQYFHRRYYASILNRLKVIQF